MSRHGLAPARCGFGGSVSLWALTTVLTFHLLSKSRPPPPEPKDFGSGYCRVPFTQSFHLLHTYPKQNMFPSRQSSIDSTMSLGSTGSSSSFDTLEPVSTRLPEELYTLSSSPSSRTSLGFWSSDEKSSRRPECNVSSTHWVSNTMEAFGAAGRSSGGNSKPKR